MVNELTAQLRKFYAPNSRTEISVPDHSIYPLLETAAKFYPNRIAIDFLGAITTYAQLLDQTRRAATVFAQAGVKAGDVVGLVLPNCPQHIVAFYGAMKLGATVAEHNPLAPAAQLEQQIVRHAGKVLVVWENSFDKIAPIAAKHGIKVITVNLVAALPAISRFVVELPLSASKKQREKLRPVKAVPASVPQFEKLLKFAKEHQEDIRIDNESTAVLLHTGGTTGTPKAVELTHRNLLANTEQSAAWVPTLHEGAEVFAATLPFFHAFGMTLSLLAAVRMVATIMVFPTFDVDMIISGQRRRPITFFPGVAPMFKRMAAKVKASEIPIDLSSIRFSLSGAMALDPKIAAEWEHLTGGYIIEGYGMTEASPILLGNPVSPDRQPSTLGIPYPSTEVRIVDPENPENDVPWGEKGEILVRGPQVFKGYLGEPEETENAMFAGWLRTGDIGKVENNTIVMADRKKELIITGGFNVYPSEVEESMRSMPGVEDVAVVGMPDASSGEQIVAAIVTDGTAKVDLETVRAWAEKTLSHYALPRRIEIVPELPRSQVGKVLRRSVREQLLAAQAGVEASWASVQETAVDAIRTVSEQTRAVADQLLSSAKVATKSAENESETEESGNATAQLATETSEKGEPKEL
ncbi:hypothetical protein BK816_05740 [Boudabousia tangfeifanii]|uniref:Long-chain fatty acid--CoA ligase n=1 Tax=Boudabousia tangfeifanii TaxID=1912795 RepID=A0A1D9MKP4_9ACTO|nr:AMP-binding protein [Boudabousia tangfeifanii]AOZ72856.1 hypothetical protein BK816_05740 [Boudabousia tangfeifanii]